MVKTYGNNNIRQNIVLTKEDRGKLDWISHKLFITGHDRSLSLAVRFLIRHYWLEHRNDPLTKDMLDEYIKPKERPYKYDHNEGKFVRIEK